MKREIKKEENGRYGTVGKKGTVNKENDKMKGME